MSIPSDLKYAKSHEWVRIEGEQATVGISHFAQKQLGDLTFVELPALGDTVTAGAECSVVESVKAASDIYSPLSGTISEINETLEDTPEVINTDAFGQGWIFKITLSDPSELETLLDATAYAEIAPEG